MQVEVTHNGIDYEVEAWLTDFTDYIEYHGGGFSERVTDYEMELDGIPDKLEGLEDLKWKIWKRWHEELISEFYTEEEPELFRNKI